jgi:hypothetical protein
VLAAPDRARREQAAFRHTAGSTPPRSSPRTGRCSSCART